jgi:hypothetical protein
MSDKHGSDEDQREEFAKGGRAKWSQKYDPNLKKYPKWAKDNTSTVPNDPANQINRAKGEPEKPAPGVSFNNGTKTITDGSTTQYSAENDPVLGHFKEVPIANMGNPEKQHYPPCINPRCKSFGKSHPNCLCYAGPGGSSLEAGWFAHGGCVGSHKEECEHYADGGQIQEQQQFINNPTEAIDHVVSHHGLLHVLTKFGKSRSENPHKPIEDYVDANKGGRKKIHGHISNIIGNGKLEINHDKESREALKAHLSELQHNPEKMIDIGGNIGDILPMHAAALGSRAANAVSYLNTLKPQRPRMGPLSEPSRPDPLAEAKYNRHLDIANNPNLVLQHVKDGTINQQDLTTLNTLYPDLAQSMKNKAYEIIIESKEKGQVIPYKQRIGLSRLLGQPLDYTVTPQAMMAIMQANTPSQSPQQGPKKASGTELNQISKTNELYETTTQDRLADQKQK